MRTARARNDPDVDDAKKGLNQFLSLALLSFRGQAITMPRSRLRSDRCMDVITAVVQCDGLDSAKEVDEHYAWSSCPKRDTNEAKERDMESRWQL